VVDGEQQMLVLREVDKLDKRGVDYVRRTLTGEGFGLPAERVDEILAFVALRSNSHAEALAMLAGIGGGNAQLDAGIAELTEVLNLVKGFGVPETDYALNFSIARGLDYYTGTVYETILTDHPQIGSVCSGGRYENLASHYTKSRLPGVGISIGATRLYYQLREAGLIGTAESTVQVLVTQMDPSLMPTYLDVATELRRAGINTELVLDSGKLGKQLKYASKAGIRFAVIVGENEVAKSAVMVKDLAKEEQFEVPRAELIKALRVEIEQAEALGELKRRGRKA
jgi:histidyl-tRNA synthetase